MFFISTLVASGLGHVHKERDRNNLNLNFFRNRLNSEFLFKSDISDPEKAGHFHHIFP